VPQGRFYTRTAGSGLLTELFSFNPQKELESKGRLVVGHLPEPVKGGAFIDIYAREWRPETATLSAWADKDWRDGPDRSPSAPSPTIQVLEMPPESGISGAIMTVYDVIPDASNAPAQRCASVCWEFKQRSFAAHLYYLRSDGKGPKFEQNLLEVVRSIRPLQK